MFQSHLYGIESYLSVNTPFDELRFNRTFMELKATYLMLSARRTLVSIAPLWNWKPCSAPLHARWLRVSIAPLWNWKVGMMMDVLRMTCFNRTFMELKDTSSPIWHPPLLVSIAPLWNWKLNLGLARPRHYCCFNRTFMELKERCPMSMASFSGCFNRTFMELKVCSS